MDKMTVTASRGGDSIPSIVGGAAGFSTFGSGGIFGSSPRVTVAPGYPQVLENGIVQLPKITVTMNRTTLAYYQANYNLASSWWAATVFTMGIPVVNSLYRANWANMNGNTRGRNIAYAWAAGEAATLGLSGYLSYLSRSSALTTSVEEVSAVGRITLREGDAVLAIVKDGRVIAQTSDVMLSHAEFVRRTVGILPSGAEVVTIGKFNGQIMALSSQTFYGNQLPSSAAQEAANLFFK